MRGGTNKKPKLDPGLLAAHKAYEAAINSNQVDLVMAMYDEGAAQMPPDAPQTEGWDGLRRAVAEYFAAYKTTWKKVVQANWVSGEWGYDQGHDTAVDIARDGSGTTYYDCKGILIYKRQPNGEWKVFRDIWNNNKAPRHVSGDEASKGAATPRSAGAGRAPKAKAAPSRSAANKAAPSRSAANKAAPSRSAAKPRKSRTSAR